MPYEEITKLLARHKIGLWNVLAGCEREGSADSSIQSAEPNDLETLFENFPTIRHVFFESLAAQRFYDRFFERRPEISYRTLPSVSARFARMNLSQKVEAWREVALAAGIG